MSAFRTLTSLGLALAAVAVTAVESKAQDTSNNYNYVGAGVGSLGYINGKATLSPKLSLRPMATTAYGGDYFGVIAPVTYDFGGKKLGSGTLHPFVGGGITLQKVFDQTSIGPVISGGVDYRFGNNWVANGTVYAVSTEYISGGEATVGIGYSF